MMQYWCLFGFGVCNVVLGGEPWDGMPAGDDGIGFLKQRRRLSSLVHQPGFQKADLGAVSESADVDATLTPLQRAVRTQVKSHTATRPGNWFLH